MRPLATAVALVMMLSGCAASNEYLLGEDLYVRSCAVCHGLSGEGGTGDAIGAGTNTDVALSDEQIAGVITVGPGNMPGYTRLSQEQVQSLVRYVRSLAE